MNISKKQLPAQRDETDDLRNSQTKQEEDIGNQDPWESSTTIFWRDPDAEFCCICGDDEDLHSELKCPYNYLSPASYVPCRARLTIWNDEVFKPEEMFGGFKGPNRQDRIATRRRESLQRFVRVTNLPASCCRGGCAGRLTGLLAQFGPLRMYHVAMRDGGGDDGRGGFGCVVFERREDAEKAIDELNCYDVDGHSLRVDWVYPSLC